MISTPESSNVEAIGYDQQYEEVWVVFRSSGAYRYPGVPEHVWEEFVRSSSKGQFVNQVLKVDYVGFRS
ncbi:KTSC domain-containing protein [Subtercola frigoramans]